MHMDQVKIGKFIASQRKEQGFTQSQLAEKLGITDKAVSKWETGKSLPDLSLFAPLCSLLDITLNELLLGEVISDDCLKEKSNQVLLDVISGMLGNDRERDSVFICLFLSNRNMRRVPSTEVCMEAGNHPVNKGEASQPAAQ